MFYDQVIAMTSKETQPKATARGGSATWALIFLLAAPSWAADAPLSLADVIDHALARNPGLQAIRRQAELAQAGKLTAAQWLYNPELATSMESGSGDDYELGLDISQQFELGGQRNYRKTIAEANIQRGASLIANSERQLRYEVTTLFLEILALESRIELTAKKLGIAMKIAETTEALFNAGQIPVVEHNLARLQFLQARGGRAQLAAQLRRTRLQLAALMGSKTNVTLKGELEAKEQNFDRKSLLDHALATRPDLRSMEHRSDMAQSELDLTRAGITPDLEVGAFYKREKVSLGNLSESDHSLGLRFRVGLPMLNRKKGEVAQSQARLRIAEATGLDLRAQIERDLDLSLNRLSIAGQMVALYKTEINPLPKENLKVFEEAYQAGEVGLLEVLRAEEEQNRVHLAYLDAVLEYNLATAALESVVGRGLAK